MYFTNRFQVDPRSGVIIVAQCKTPGSGNCLDHETNHNYFLSFQVSLSINKKFSCDLHDLYEF